MSARLPLLHKTPFVLDARPLFEAGSPHAGLLSVSRVYRALGLPALVGAELEENLELPYMAYTLERHDYHGGEELEENLGRPFMASALEHQGHQAEISPFNFERDTASAVSQVAAFDSQIAQVEATASAAGSDGARSLPQRAAAPANY